ncbi:MAG: hypothetical protein GY839_02635 [candidate division Zixibacteria bacterium]|nr:hypothetical protein [candidate division Zixibacteria bacterium]
MITLRVFVSMIYTFLLIAGCSEQQLPVTEITHYNLDNLGGLITQDNIEFDKEISSDGFGSIKIIAAESTTVRLFETGDIDIEDCRLIYRGKIRTDNFSGQAFLEMCCGFPGKGEYFSRDLQSLVTGSVEWVTEETHFFLKKGENPDNVKLNLVINGAGTVWIDDIHLLKAPSN